MRIEFCGPVYAKPVPLIIQQIIARLYDSLHNLINEIIS